MNLVEYTTNYIKSRDAIERKLKSLDTRNGELRAIYKDKEVTFIPVEKLASALNINSRQGYITLVTLQNEENFEALVRHFPVFSENPFLTIIFCNPSVSEKWVLKPAIHASVADKSTLKSGLQSLYNSVQAI